MLISSEHQPGLEPGAGSHTGFDDVLERMGLHFVRLFKMLEDVILFLELRNAKTLAGGSAYAPALDGPISAHGVLS